MAAVTPTSRAAASSSRLAPEGSNKAEYCGHRDGDRPIRRSRSAPRTWLTENIRLKFSKLDAARHHMQAGADHPDRGRDGHHDLREERRECRGQKLNGNQR